MHDAPYSPLTNLPYEIILKIVEVTHPKDLLTIARVSKQFRGLLMHPTSASLWKHSLALHEPSLPECPASMSEPRWAHLVFEEQCTFCGANDEVTEVNWYLRVRSCKQCAKSCIKTSLQDGFRPLSDGTTSFERLIPSKLACLDSMSFFTYGCFRSWSYLAADYEAVKAEYLSIRSDADRRQFVEERIALANSGRAHSHRCEIWSLDANLIDSDRCATSNV
ncbi:hypothetical protein BDN71DRAFT_1432956 [Pleurotus eryngii]|uniref:F-box domain-containing protein n=1 Tax=Pleurotus eryngii TaxID=5323 RepID=A0A9P6DE55_PLEER|nr:hypothetical protein BDN71DRAFT_1432956 [Pleurotus eryngii]